MVGKKKRKTLTLSRASRDANPNSVGKVRVEHSSGAPSAPTKSPVVGKIDFQLPCRDYLVDFKVADTQRLTVTLEYLLRLLKLLGRLTEEELAKFFDYSRDELEFVLNEAQARQYIVWRHGQVDLSAAGRKVFAPGENIPYALELQSYSKRVGFDLVSFGLERRESMSRFERFLPELEIADTSFVESGAQSVPEVFRRNYFEIMMSDSRLERERKELYSIDKVSSGERFSSILSIEVRQDSESVGQPDFSICGPRGQQSPAENASVYERVSAFLSHQCRVRRETDETSMDVFNALIEPALESPLFEGIGSVPTAESISMALTTCLKQKEGNSSFYGSPLLPKTIAQLVGAIQGGKIGRDCNSNVSWLVPNVPIWGMTRNLPVLLDQVTEELGLSKRTGGYPNSSREGERDAQGELGLNLEWMHSGKLERHVEAAFETYHSSGYELSLSNNLVEVLVCSDAAVMIAIHLPPARGSSLLVPSGLLSSSSKVIGLAQQYLEKLKSYS